jgi:hypothetical protein
MTMKFIDIFGHAAGAVAKRKLLEAEKELDNLLRLLASAKAAGRPLPPGYWEDAYRAREAYRTAVRIYEAIRKIEDET